jgi:L,D-transpeptidase ErfK/SrfK
MRTIIIWALTMALGLAAALQEQTLTGGVHAVVVARGDTLRSLGSRFGVDAATIARDNGRTPDAALRVGETLTIDNRHVVPAFEAGVSIVVNVPQRMLFAATSAGLVAYPVGVGRPSWPTPLGEFSIVTKETNPTWDVPASIREEARRAGRSLPAKVPPGPRNPLGAHWLGLSVGSVGIHGTNAPTSVYQAVTHGCIRLRPHDIAALFRQVQIGAKGQLIYQPLLLGVDGDEVFVEAHRDVYGRGPSEALEFVRARARELGVVERIDWDAATQVIRERAGIARAVSRRDQLSRARVSSTLVDAPPGSMNQTEAHAWAANACAWRSASNF